MSLYVAAYDGVCFFFYCAVMPPGLHNTKPTNERKDTSMTATMLLQDSMLNPSVFRSPSKIQEKQSFTMLCISILDRSKCVNIVKG